MSNIARKQRRCTALGLMALEPRIMFDGAAVVDAAHAVLTDAQKSLIPSVTAPTVAREADPTKNNGKKEVVWKPACNFDPLTGEIGVEN
jgi:hypothetical protein